MVTRRSRRCGRSSLVVLASVLIALAGAPRVNAAAVGIRIADHAAYVRAVVDFTGATPSAADVRATDPAPSDGTAALDVVVPGAAGQRLLRSADGLTVRVTTRSNHIRIALAVARGRFKYLAYTVLARRIALDLYKSAPPGPGAAILHGAAGCLTLISASVRIDGLVRASGSERGLFEHRLLVAVRGRDGRVMSRTTVHPRFGRWSAALSSRATRDQSGTIEAVAASPKDGALACLVQKRVVLPFSSPVIQPQVYRAHADVDGDGRGDLITLRPSGAQHRGGRIRVRLATGRRLSITTPTFAAALPALVTVGHVDARPGVELFVDDEHISTNDTVGLYTYRAGALHLAGRFPISGHPGLFGGITCSSRGAARFVIQHRFVLQPQMGSPRYWTRQDTRYVWQGSALRLAAIGAVRRISGTPPPSMVGIRCGHRPAP